MMANRDFAGRCGQKSMQDDHGTCQILVRLGNPVWGGPPPCVRRQRSVPLGVQLGMSIIVSDEHAPSGRG